MALVSVVTPVYNGEQYLSACIESVLAQSFSDWEYVIVDNCSSDGSRSIAESYAKDKRVRVYHNNEVLPVIANFNRAASLVSPEARYLKFVCADDLLFRDCLEMMVDLAESKPTVRLVGSYKIHGQDPVCEGPPFPQEVVSGKEVCKWFFQGRLGVLGSPTNHLIRLPTASVGGHLFDGAFAAHADTEFFVRVLKDGADFGFIHQVLTFTRIHDASVTERYSHTMGTGVLESLAMLVKHGHAFLSEEEKRDLVRAHRRNYCRFLFRVLLKVWNRRIWEYHVANRKKLGIQIGLLEVAKAGLWEAAASAVSPVDTARRLRREYSRARRLRESRPRQPDAALP